MRVADAVSLLAPLVLATVLLVWRLQSWRWLRLPVTRPRELGAYRLQSEIGKGAVGVVYRARHMILRRPAAVKLLAPHRTSEADVRRFEREMRLTATLSHPNTVAVYDCGRSPTGVFYYAMEYIDGVSLEQLVARSGPQPAGRVIHLLRQACASLAEAHGAGLIHRDIKPANLMVCRRGGTSDVLKVVDFGLVKPLELSAPGGASMTNDIVGTPHYMSPEAFLDPSTVDPRSDLYALGAVGYFLLTGTPVFEGASTLKICARHLGEAPQPPSRRLGAAVPADLEALILRCLAKRAAERPSSATELDALLAACAAA